MQAHASEGKREDLHCMLQLQLPSATLAWHCRIATARCAQVIDRTWRTPV